MGAFDARRLAKQYPVDDQTALEYIKRAPEVAAKHIYLLPERVRPAFLDNARTGLLALEYHPEAFSIGQIRRFVSKFDIKANRLTMPIRRLLRYPPFDTKPPKLPKNSWIAYGTMEVYIRLNEKHATRTNAFFADDLFAVVFGSSAKLNRPLSIYKSYMMGSIISMLCACPAAAAVNSVLDLGSCFTGRMMSWYADTLCRELLCNKRITTCVHLVGRLPQLHYEYLVYRLLTRDTDIMLGGPTLCECIKRSLLHQYRGITLPKQHVDKMVERFPQTAVLLANKRCLRMTDEQQEAAKRGAVSSGIKEL